MSLQNVALFKGKRKVERHLSSYVKWSRFQQRKTLKQSAGRKTSSSFVLNYFQAVLTSMPCLKSQDQVSSSETPKRNIKRTRSFTHHNETFPFSPQRSGFFSLSSDTDSSQLGDSNLQHLYEIFPSVIERKEVVGKRKTFANISTLRLVHE